MPAHITTNEAVGKWTGPAQRNSAPLVRTRLMAAQRPDGGWSLASLVDNTADPALKDDPRVSRAKAESGYGTKFLAYVGRDGSYQSTLASDGYATGLAVYVARQAGVPATDEPMQRGVGWLKSHQRESGRWFTPSQSWHTSHLITNAGTAYAVLALEACGEVKAVDAVGPASSK